MLRNLARVFCAAALSAAALAVFLAGPLTASPAVSVLPALALELPSYLLSIAG